MLYEIETYSGSLYYVREDDGRFFLSMENRINPDSMRIEGEWEITRPDPWPAIEALPLLMLSAYFEEPGHPLRIPGGGKITSPVVRITLLPPLPSD